MESEQVWLITGGGRGLGRALVDAALAEGHRVVATVRSEHSLPTHDRLTVTTLDVKDRNCARSVVERVIREFGRLDVLINNAGYGLVGAIEEVDEEEARAILDTNLLGSLWLSQAVLPSMRAAGVGDIVQISTVGAVGTMPTLGLYNASKWGLEGFSEALANEVRDFGVRVTIAQLGSVDTEWSTRSMQFSEPNPAYNDLRTRIFGSPEVPWEATAGTGGGTAAAVAAAAIIDRIADKSDHRIRVLIGDDAPAHVRAALALRQVEYDADPRFPAPVDVVG